MPKETREEQMNRLGIRRDLKLAGPKDSRQKVGGVLAPRGRPEFGTAVGATDNRSAKIR